MNSLNTANKLQGFRFCSNGQQCDPQERPPQITRFTYRLDSYNSLDEFYLHQEQTRIQEGLEGTKEEVGTLMQSKRGFSQIKTNVLKRPQISDYSILNVSLTKVKEDNYEGAHQKKFVKEKELPFGSKIREQKQRKIRIKGIHYRQAAQQIYEQQEDSYSPPRKKAKIQHSNHNIRQDRQNLHSKYEMQSVSSRLSQQPRTMLKHQHSRSKDSARAQKNLMFCSHRQESEQGLFKKGHLGNKRQQINNRYQNPDDMIDKDNNNAHRYLQLMQREINAALFGQNVENFVRYWVSTNGNYEEREAFSPDSKQESQSEQKGHKESLQDQSRVEKQKREHPIKQAEQRPDLHENESNGVLVDPVLQGESQEYRIANLDAIFNYDGSEFCFRDNQENQLFELNQFLLN